MCFNSFLDRQKIKRKKYQKLSLKRANKVVNEVVTTRLAIIVYKFESFGIGSLSFCILFFKNLFWRSKKVFRLKR